MTSPTGRQKKRNRAVTTAAGSKVRAFTLIELMLVAVIISAIVALSTPLFKRTYEDLRIVSSAKEMAAIIRFCRERAVFERRNFRLAIDIDRARYQVFAMDEDGKEFKPLRSRWGRVFRLPYGIDIETEVETITLSPDGTATGALIYLTNNEGRTYTISIEHHTGFVGVYDYRKE